jgi:predicted DNA-binding protein
MLEGAMTWLSKLFSGHVNECKIDGGKLFILWDGSKHYHAWSVNGNKQHVWPKIKEAFQNDNGHRTDLIMTSGNTYTFVEEDIYDSFSNSMMKVELYYNKNIVSCFAVESLDYDFALSSVEFIKDGEWQKDIADFLIWKREYDVLIRRKTDEMMERSRIKNMNKTLES